MVLSYLELQMLVAIASQDCGPANGNAKGRRKARDKRKSKKKR